MTKQCIALLGRRDLPTDGVEDYCTCLAAALLEHEVSLEIVRVNWDDQGWAKALDDLRETVKNTDAWVLLQYTALAWSRRGFSWRILRVIRLLKRSGARVATVFHDAVPYFGDRVVDRIRRRVQLYTMRQMVRLSDLSITTIPTENVPWAASLPRKPAVIPVGANLPSPERAWVRRSDSSRPCVGVFSLSSGRVGADEINVIAESALYVAQELGALRVVIIGRNSEMAGPILLEKFQGKPIEVVVRGLLSADEVVEALGSCDAMLFVRGPISSRRGSAIAGIACGLPVVASKGWETAAPVTEAGVVLVPTLAAREFGPALLRVLRDSAFRAELAERSRNAQKEYFSWEAIAAKYAEVLGRCNSSDLSAFR